LAANGAESPAQTTKIVSTLRTKAAGMTFDILTHFISIFCNMRAKSIRVKTGGKSKSAICNPQRVFPQVQSAAAPAHQPKEWIKGQIKCPERQCIPRLVGLGPSRARVRGPDY
jgi:hypothetical protein